MEKLKALIKKVCTREVISYIIFGVLTTLVNIVAYNLLSKLCHLEENVSQWIAIFLSVIFAFFTNRKMGIPIRG